MNDVICKTCGWKGHHSRLKGAYEEIGLEVVWSTYCPRCESEEVEPLETPESYFVGYDIETGELFEEENKLIYLNAVMQILENEIKWCRDNLPLAPSQDSAEWFIKGLIQAKNLIFELSEVDYQTPLADIEIEDDSTPDTPEKKSSQVNFAFGEGGNLENMTDENQGCPGYMGDYGGIPQGPFDL